MKVFYDICFVDPWLKVAKNIKDEHGWESVYRDVCEDSKNIVPNTSSNCKY
jgi:hypothetical protein